jgi:hypothetical protein
VARRFDVVPGIPDPALHALSGGPFVFNLGHGIVKNTPPRTCQSLGRAGAPLDHASAAGLVGIIVRCASTDAHTP